MILKIKPNQNCKACHGQGELFDSVPWGSTTALFPSWCDCVLDQIPEDDDDSEIELVFDEPESRAYFEDVYAKYSALLDGVRCPICVGIGSVEEFLQEDMSRKKIVTCKTCTGVGYVTKEKYQEMLRSLPETRED